MSAEVKVRLTAAGSALSVSRVPENVDCPHI